MTRTGIRVDELFCSIAEKYPNRAAIISDELSLSYADVTKRSKAAASYLQEIGVTPQSAVMIISSGGPNAIIAMLAVLMAGASYVPADPAYPDARLELMVRESGACWALTTEPEVTAVGNLVTIAVNAIAERPCAKALHQSMSGPDDIAYIMFTSGTTGEPKPVGVTHRGVVDLALDGGPLTLAPEDGVLLHSTLAFDASTFEIWASLLVGAKVVSSPGSRISLQDLTDYLSKSQVTVAWLTAPVFRLLAEYQAGVLGSLRLLVVGGDVVDAASARQIAGEFPETTIVNGYGPTENTTFSTAFAVDEWDLDECQSFPIGHSFPGTSCYVLSEGLEPVKNGDVGELYLAGERLARGYLNRPAETAKRFLPNPFTREPGQRMYKTGDRVRKLPSDALEYLGRNDQEVKIRGFRVNLAEALAVLRADEEVHEAFIITETGPEGAFLVGFVTPEAIDIVQLRKRMKRRTPEYLIADKILSIDAFPLASTGKIDRKELVSIFLSSRSRADPDEHHLAVSHAGLPKIWQRHSGFYPNADSDFFGDGGTSLSLMALVEDVRLELGVTLDFGEVYAASGFIELAELIESSAENRPDEIMGTVH